MLQINAQQAELLLSFSSLIFSLSLCLPLPLTLPLGHSNLAKAAANCPDPWPRWQHNDRDRWQSWIIGAAGFYSEMKVREGGGGVKAVREKETGETDTVTVLINRSLAGRHKTWDDPRSTFCCSRVIKNNIYWTESKREQMLCCVSPGRWSHPPGLKKKEQTLETAHCVFWVNKDVSQKATKNLQPRIHLHVCVIGRKIDINKNNL